MKASKSDANISYYVALLDWGKVLAQDDMKKFARDITSSQSPIDGWYTKEPQWPNLKDQVADGVFGYYHSRIIFRFRLLSVPDEILGMRKLREKLETAVKEFLEKNIIHLMKSYTNRPRIFIYPIFEIRSEESFWKFKEDKTYSLPTTCFYTELDDPKGRRFERLVGSLYPRKVKMRVSGAKIITSETSNWFFWNLINIVFHEGLYRQSRETKPFEAEGVYAGLENRLEDFAGSLMTTFHDLARARVQDLIAKVALILTILGILIAVFRFIVPWLSQIKLPDP